LAPVSTTLNVDGIIYSSVNRKGIFSASTTNYSGILNASTPQGNGSPNAAYPQYAFKVPVTGLQGTLNLYVNNDTTPLYSTADLSTCPAGNYLNAHGSGFVLLNPDGGTTHPGTINGFVESFPQGAPFTFFAYRVGTWNVNINDLRDGWNWIRVIQILNSSNLPLVNQYCDFVIDKNTTASVSTAESLYGTTSGDGLLTTATGLKYLSGVKYYTGGTANYTVTWSNVYKNTYNNTSNAVSYASLPSSSPSSPALVSITSDFLPHIGSGPNYQNSIFTPIKTATIATPGIRLNPTLGDTITVKSTALRTVQPTVGPTTGGSITNILLDNVSASSTSESSSVTPCENFADEVYRVPSNANFDLYTTAGVGPNLWNSMNSLTDAAAIAGYSDGLQVYNGTLVYPSINFLNPPLINGPTNNIDYSGGVCTGVRSYYRYFKFTLAHSNFTFKINGTGCTPVSYGTSLTTGSGQIIILFKLPNYNGGTGNGTGWMDVTKNYATGYWADGNGCLLSGTFSIGNVVTLDLGIKNTGSTNVNGYDYMWIQVPQNWSGKLSGITLEGI
jgi:hypothetical protein